MIGDMKAPLGSDLQLAVLQCLIKKFEDFAAGGADHVVMMATFIELEDGAVAFEMVATYQARHFELRHDAVDSCQAYLFSGVEQLSVDLFCRQVPRLAGLENLQDPQAR